MKMKKSTWLLLVLAIAAIFLVAGCAPTGPAPTPPDENGEEPPPTPPADTAAPKVVKTTVSNAEGRGDGAFKITIVFDEDIYSPCAEDPDNWEIRVVNSQRREGSRNILIPADDIFGPQIVGNQIILYAWVAEFGAPVVTYKLVALPTDFTGFTDLEEAVDAAQDVVDAVDALSDAAKIAFLMTHNADGEYDALLLALNAANAVLADPDATEGEITAALGALNNAYGLNGLGLEAVETGRTTPTFAGLICSQEDADAYEAEFGIEVTAADVVTWTLSDDCTISDVLGNSQCGYSGQACCVGPSCEECEECDLTTGVCK